MSSLVDLIKNIRDSLPAEINLQLSQGGSVQLKCVYKESIAPNFFLVFPPKTTSIQHRHQQGLPCCRKGH